MKRRLRIEVWSTLQESIEDEIKRTGMSANQIVNLILVEAFKKSPKNE